MFAAARAVFCGILLGFLWSGMAASHGLVYYSGWAQSGASFTGRFYFGKPFGGTDMEKGHCGCTRFPGVISFVVVVLGYHGVCALLNASPSALAVSEFQLCSASPSSPPVSTCFTIPPKERAGPSGSSPLPSSSGVPISRAHRAAAVEPHWLSQTQSDRAPQSFADPTSPIWR